MANQIWEVQQRLGTVLPLGDEELIQIATHANGLNTDDGCAYFRDLLGDSPEAGKFVQWYRERRHDDKSAERSSEKGGGAAFADPPEPTMSSQTTMNGTKASSKETGDPSATRQLPAYAPPPGRPPGSVQHYHTNPVIEAARFRAHDEVSERTQS